MSGGRLTKQVLDQACTFIKKDALRIAGIDDDRDREEAIVEYRRYANRSGVSNVAALASFRLRASLDDFDVDDTALCVGNGWIDLKTGERHTLIQQKCSAKLAQRFSRFSEPRLWRQTVEQVFNKLASDRLFSESSRLQPFRR